MLLYFFAVRIWDLELLDVDGLLTLQVDRVLQGRGPSEVELVLTDNSRSLQQQVGVLLLQLRTDVFSTLDVVSNELDLLLVGGFACLSLSCL